MSENEPFNFIHTATDLLVARTLNLIEATMFENCIKSQIWQVPRSFDMLFFHVTAAKSVAALFDHLIIDPLPNYQKSHGVNYPDFTCKGWQISEFVSSGLAKEFVSTIHQESNSLGPDFDVNFACVIFANAIDNSVSSSKNEKPLNWIEQAKGQTYKPISQMLKDGDNIWD